VIINVNRIIKFNKTPVKNKSSPGCDGRGLLEVAENSPVKKSGSKYLKNQDHRVTIIATMAITAKASVAYNVVLSNSIMSEKYLLVSCI